MDRNHQKYIFIFLPLAVIAAAVILILVLAKPGRQDAQITEGLEYIRSMESLDVNAVEKEVNAVRQSLFFEDLDEKIEEDPDYVWTALDQIGTVMMGDSRTMAFASYGFMDASRVLAEGGKTIRGIEDHFEELWAANPSLVVLAYGLNDIDWLCYDPVEYAEIEMEYVDYIQEHLPDARIYIQSILIPRERVEEFYDIPGLVQKAITWDAQSMQIYEERGYNTIDVSDLVEENEDLFGEDGSHFYAPFYPLLAERILKQYLKDTMVFND